MASSFRLGGGGSEESLDELALSGPQLPPPSPRRSKTPLAYRSPNVRTQYLNLDAAPTFRGASPSKSMILETPAKPGSSPWRIKVTVQAEPNSDAPISDTPSKPSARRPRSAKTTVPLKDADSPVKRPRGRPRKSEGTPAPSAIKKRKGTPMRRRSARLSGDNYELKGGAKDAGEKPAPRPRGRPRKSTVNAVAPAESTSPRSEVRHSIEDAEMEDVQIASPPPNNQHSTQNDDVLSNPAEFDDAAALLSPLVERQPSPPRAPTPPVINSEPQNPISTLSAHPYAYEVSPAVTPAIVNHEPVAKEGAAAGRKSSSAFAFADLTPLHMKFPLAKPSPEKFAPIFSRLKASAVVPDGWSRPVFSPIPARQLASQEHKITRGSQLHTTGSLRSSQVQVLADVIPNEHSLSEKDKIPASEDVHEEEQAEEQDVEEEQGQDTSDHDNDELQPADRDDAEMWRHMVNTREDRDDISTQGAPTSAADDSDDSDFGDGGMELTGRPIGEQTMMQSEEFSMVSIDSLRELQSSFVENSFVEGASILPTKPTSKLNQTLNIDLTPNQTRSSPRNSSRSRNTPATKPNSSGQPSVNNSSRNAKSSPRVPSSPTHAREAINQVRAHRLSSPKIVARIAQASNTLQDALSSPIRDLSRRSSMHEERSLSMLTRSSDLQSSSSNASAQPSPRNKHQTSRAKPTPSAILPSHTRLPTPLSLERDPHGYGASVAETEHPELRLPPPDSSSESPAKSIGEMSWQTQTPPSTRRGTPTSDKGDKEEDAMRDEPSSSHRRTPSSNKVIEKEAVWQRAREEVSRTIQSAKSSSVIVIESEKESDDEDEDEDDSDLWQEEASREEPSQLSHSRSMVSANRVGLFSPVELQNGSRPHKVSRTWRRTSATDSSALDNITHEETRSHPSLIDDEQVRQAANSAAISALFKALGDSTQGGEITNSPAHAPPPEHSTLNQMLSPSRHQRQSSALLPSPAKGILKRRLSFGRADSPARDGEIDHSQAHDTSFNTTYADTNVSMASDVRQIRRELNVARKHTNPQAAREETLKVPTKLRSVDDSVEEEREHADTSTMLSITPKRTPKPLFPETRFVEPRQQQPRHKNTPQARKAMEPPVAAAGTTIRKAAGEAIGVAPSLLTRVWSYLPFGCAPPLRPTHPMLANLPLLPKAEPWTRTHYLTVLRLYERYLRNPAPFSPSHPSNATLLIPAFIPYIDLEVVRWGYYVKLNTSHIIIASLFSQLLVLKDVEEYKQVEGEDIDVGECLPGPAGEVINEWKCVKRLFSVISGKMLRKDEAEGRTIDRTGHMKWKFAGDEEWIVWRKSRFGSLSDGRGVSRT